MSLKIRVVEITIALLTLCIAMSDYGHAAATTMRCTEVPESYGIRTPWARWSALPAAQLAPHRDFHPNGTADLSCREVLAWNSSHLSDEAIRALNEYVAKAGELLCLGDNLGFDHYGKPRLTSRLAQSSRIVQIPLRSDARGYGRIWPKLFSLAAIRVPFTTKGADGDCAWGVEIRSASMENRRQLVFLANTNPVPVRFGLTRADRAKIPYEDLISGKIIAGDSISMAANQVMLLRAERQSPSIDALQADEGKSAMTLRGDAFRATLGNDAFAGIYKSPKGVAVTLSADNLLNLPLAVTSDWQLRRLPGNGVVSSGRVTLRVAPGGHSKTVLPFPARAGFGLYEYLVSTSAQGHSVKSEARVAIMRAPPDSREMDNLGMNIHVAGEENARLVRRLGLRWTRVDWHMQLCAPGKDQVIWDFMDRQVAASDKYGLKLFPIFGAGDPPAWMQLSNGTFNVQYHADYIASIMRRYKGKIPAFDVYNEPEQGAITAYKNPGLWKADLEAVRKAARDADPGAGIVGIGLSGNTGDPGGWWINLLSEPSVALGQYLDACDWHNYPAPRNRRPEESNSICSGVDGLKESVPRVRALVAGKGVWITEHGFSTCNRLNPAVVEMSKGFPQGAPFDVTEKQQGDFLVRQVLLELAYGIDRVFLYQLGPDGTDDSFEGQFGITRSRPGGLSAKPAYVQIANMVQELAGAVPVAVDIPSPNVRIARFRRDLTDVVAAWTVRGTAKLKFQVKDGYLSDPYGNRTPSEGTITVGIAESPVYLVGRMVR